MIGIDANRPVYFLHGAYRFFCPHERHISRLCRVNVLLLVFDGTLRFVEDGIAYEVKKGQYHIQKAGSSQEGTMESDSPKYCYFHFSGEWLEDDTVIPKTGVFDIQQVQSITRIFDPNQENHHTWLEESACFFEIMKLLFQWRKEPQGIAESIASYFQRNYGKRITLDTVCEEYHYSKNYLIRVFSKKYHMTPNVYLNHLRMEQAERLLEATPDSLLNISERCGFASYSHFCKTFFRYHQMSPSQWREEKKNIDHQMEDDNGLFKR